MSVNVIGTLKPKNNGKFPVAEAVDIKVTDDLRLDEALENKADLSTVNFALAGKADNSDINSLQSQINEIITPVTQDAEVQNARVGADGTSYNTLKARLDAEQSAQNSAIETNNLQISELIESTPKTIVEEDLLPSLEFTEDTFVGSNGTIKSYTGLKYAVVKAVSVGDRFKFSGRKFGDEYSILVVASPIPVDNKFTVLDVVTDGYDDLGYISNAEYVCTANGYLIYQTQGSILNLKAIQTEYTFASSTDVTQLDEDLGTLTDYVDDIFTALPKNKVLVDVTNDIEWHSGYYISVTNGIVTAYAGLAYGIIGTMKKGEKVYVSNSRGIGSSRALTLISLDGIVDGRCTVLDYVPDEVGYYSGYYEAPENGILCISWNDTDLSNYPVYRVVYKISAEGGSALKDVKWVTIGDSLNDFNTTGITKNWIKYMIEGTECDNTNLAASGTGFYRGVATAEGETSYNYIAKIAAIPEDTELITIAGSFNDISSSPWETLDVGTATDTGNTTIAGYMNAFFDELLENFPEASIGVYMTAPWIGYHYGVQRSDDYVNVLRDICLRRGIPFDDSAYYGNGLKPWIEANRVRYYTRTTGTVDGVHPNNEGHKFIYRMLRPFVEKLSPKGNL